MSLAQVYQFTYPSEPQLCLKHKLATRIWKGIQFQNADYQVCKCCGRKVGQENVQPKCCYYSQEMSFLGVGIPLYFSFMRYSIFILIVLSLVFCIFGLYTNIVSNSCKSDTNCHSNIFNTLSIINKKDQRNYMSIQNYILITFVVICIFLFQIIRYRARKIILEIDQSFHSPSDYSLIISRLPDNVGQDDIKQMVQERRSYLSDEEKINTNNLEVIEIIISYDLQDFTQKRAEYLEQFKQKIKNHQPASDFKYPILPTPSSSGYFSIITFAHSYSKQLFLYRAPFIQRFLYYFISPCIPLSQFQVKGQRVSIRRAPEPDDVVWTNAGVTLSQQLVRKFAFGTLAFVLLIGGGAAQYGLALLQKHVTQANANILLGTAASIMVTITNLLLMYYLVYSTMWEKMDTMTAYMDVLTYKLVFLQFLNSGIFVVAANILANYQTFNLQSDLSQTITQIMIFNAVTPWLTNFILYRLDISGRVLRYLCIQKQFSITTQLQANVMSQLTCPQFPFFYSYIIKTLWLTCFYCPFVPIVVPISIIGLIINYFVEKYLFGGYYSAGNNISYTVNKTCVEMLEFIPLMLSIGEWLIYMYFRKFRFDDVPKDWEVTIYLSIAISLLNLLLPMQDFNKRLWKMKQDYQDQPAYHQVQNKFQVTYSMTNPLTQNKKPRKYDINIWKKLFNSSPSIMLPSISPKYQSDSLQKNQTWTSNNQNAFNQDKPVINPLNYLKTAYYDQLGYQGSNSQSNQYPNLNSNYYTKY